MNIENKKLWLESLKAGDEVAADASMGGSRICRVVKVTATQIVLENTRYRRSDGLMIGSTAYRTSYIHPVDDKVRADVLARALSHRARCGELHKMSLANLRILDEMLKSE